MVTWNRKLPQVHILRWRFRRRKTKISNSLLIKIITGKRKWKQKKGRKQIFAINNSIENELPENIHLPETKYQKKKKKERYWVCPSDRSIFSAASWYLYLISLQDKILLLKLVVLCLNSSFGDHTSPVPLTTTNDTWASDDARNFTVFNSETTLTVFSYPSSHSQTSLGILWFNKTTTPSTFT